MSAAFREPFHNVAEARGDIMTDKPQIHIFLGAPVLPLRAVSVPSPDQGRWRTVDLRLEGGKLRPKQRKSDAIPGGQGGPDSFTLTNEGLGRLNIDSPDRSISRVQRDATPAEPPAVDTRAPSQKKHLDHEERDSCTRAVQEYLDSCFPNHGNAVARARTSGSVSTETEYLTVWTIGQALVLKGKLETGQNAEGAEPRVTSQESSPELYSPASSTSDLGGQNCDTASQELLDTLKGRQEAGGLELEATPDGILCSQSSPSKNEEGPTDRATGQMDYSRPTATDPVAGSSPQASLVFPASKKSRTSPSGVRTQEQAGPSDRTLGTIQHQPTTLLARCMTKGVPYSILVAVLYPCHLKEIKLKSGTWAGSTVPVATIVVTDQSGVEMKVVLWRIAAFWALTVYPGDLLLITAVMVNEDKWRGELVLQSTRSSRLLNLGQLTSDRRPPVPRGVSRHILDGLCTHLRQKHRLLVTLPTRIPQDPCHIPYVRLGALRPDTLVHAVLRVIRSSTFTAWRMEAASFSRTGSAQRATLTVEQGDGQQGELVLWGAAMTWLHRIERNRDGVWEFRVLLVKQNDTSGLLELHSTPWGACEPLFPGDMRAEEFCGRKRPNLGLASFEIDLQTLLSQKYTGDVELRCHITGFQFRSSSSQDASPLLNADTPLEGILGVLSGDVTFTGCGRCGSELATDANGIYRPCYPCLPHTSIRRFYRPALMTVGEGSRELCTQVPPVLVQKILQNVPPEKLNKAVAPASDRRFVRVAADALRSLLSVPRSVVTLTIHSHIQCDENSVPTAQDFLLLDFTR